MYCSVKSRIFEHSLSENIICSLGVRQGDCLSPFLFSMYINDLKGFKGIDIVMLKLLLLLYADDIAIISEAKEDLQHGLNILKDYCDKWKLKVNVNKTKVMVFKKGSRNQQSLRFLYGNTEIEIKILFEKLGFYYVWLYQGVGNETLFVPNIKQRLKDVYIQNLTELLQNSSKALLYRLFSNFEYKSYIDQIKIKKIRIALTRLRVSAHRLLTETGR